MSIRSRKLAIATVLTSASATLLVTALVAQLVSAVPFPSVRLSLFGASGAFAQSSTGQQHAGFVGPHQSPRAPLMTRDAQIADALSAAPPKIAKGAAVRNWDGTTLRQGNEDYICFPTPTEKSERGERAPMCLDKAWRAWIEAWMANEPYTPESVGIAYVLSAEASASSTDPYAWALTSDKALFSEGPSILLLIPDPALLADFPTEATYGRPFVRWKDTSYAHLVISVERSVLGP